MTFTSWGALEAGLQNEMMQAMQEVSNIAYMDVVKHTLEYYGGGTPKQYIRTGMFAASPFQEGVSGGGNYLETKVGRDGGYSYSTGMMPSGETVFGWAETPYRLVGTPGTWAATEADIENHVDMIFSVHFR